jgi:hypothetical protein
MLDVHQSRADRTLPNCAALVDVVTKSPQDLVISSCGLLSGVTPGFSDLSSGLGYPKSGAKRRM